MILLNMVVAYAIAGFVSLVPGRIDKILDRVGRTIAIIFSFGMSICLLFMGMEFTSIWMVYTLFIIYHAGFEFIYVCCLALIAKRLKVTRFAAIFALNAVAQNVTQMIIQAIIQVLELNPRKQFIAFSICAFGFSCLFTVLNVGYYIHKLLPKFKKEQDDNNTEICTENTLILGDDTN
jgi:MFS family permease